jgi:hypothetical protein
MHRIVVFIERFILKMALEALKAAVAVADAAADRLIAASEGSASQIADLTAEVANLEQDALAAVQPLLDKVVAAAPDAPSA